MAVPPFAVMPRSVTLAMVPPSTPTEPPQVSPTPMALPAFPPLLTLPMETTPPLAEAVATPPLPAEAMSVQLSPSPKNLSRRLYAAASAVARTSAAVPSQKTCPAPMM